MMTNSPETDGKSPAANTATIKKTNARELAKLGLTTTLGVLVVTGFSSRSATARKLHVLAGGALLGLSLWHSMLYQPKKRSPKKEGENK